MSSCPIYAILTVVMNRLVEQTLKLEGMTGYDTNVMKHTALNRRLNSAKALVKPCLLPELMSMDDFLKTAML